MIVQGLPTHVGCFSVAEARPVRILVFPHACGGCFQPCWSRKGRWTAVFPTHVGVFPIS